MNRFQAIDPKLLHFQPGDTLLDVGCGVGRHVLEMAHLPGRFVGLDWAQWDLRKGAYWYHLMTMEGRAKGPVGFVRGDATRMPFADGFFDHVICTEVLEHVPDDGAVLREMVRVLRPGGTMAIAVPDELLERVYWALSVQYRNTPGGHVRIYRRGQLVNMLRGAGVRPIEARFRHSIEALYWLVHILDSKDLTREGELTSRAGRVLNTISPRLTRAVDRVDAALNFVFPKSIVLYGRKLEQVRA